MLILLLRVSKWENHIWIQQRNYIHYHDRSGKTQINQYGKMVVRNGCNLSENPDPKWRDWFSGMPLRIVNGIRFKMQHHALYWGLGAV
jgi:hypothetical protein